MACEQSRTRRVVQVIYGDPVNYPPTLNTARVLAAHGVDVVCVGFRRGLSSDVRMPAGSRLHYLNSQPGAWPHSVVRKLAEAVHFRVACVRMIRERHPDLVIAYDSWGIWATGPIARAAEFPVVYHVHDSVESAAFPRWSRERYVAACAERWANNCKLVVFPEQARAERARTSWKLSARTAIVANAPPLSSATRNRTLKDLIAQRDGVRPEFLMVMAGTSGLLRESAQALSLVDPRWHLVVIGCGNVEGLRAMRDEVCRAGASSRLHVFPYTPYDTVADWLRGCDVGLAFYHGARINLNWQLMGTGSVKVMEYMAAGIPSIVASNTFQALAHETGAIELLAEESAVGIAASLDKLTPGSEHWKTLAARALAAHRECYNYDVQLRPILDLVSDERGSVTSVPPNSN